MLTPGPGRHPSAALFALVVLLSGGGCTLLIDAQLSDKSSETDGGGGGGGAAGASATSASSASSTSASSTSASSSGGLSCPGGRADCDGSAANGCEVDLMKDPANCGACHHACMDGEHCRGGACH
jgi:hypothetical protein